MRERNEKRTSGQALIVATALLWGLAGVCVKSVTWGSFSLLASRAFLSMIVLLIAKRSLSLKINKTNLLAAVCTTIAAILYISAVKLTAAGTAIVLQYIAPILVFLFEVLTKKKKLRLKEALIVFAVFAGCALSFSDQLDMTHIAGNVMALLSGFAFAAEIIITNTPESSADDCLILSNIMSFVVCLPLAFFDKNLVFDAKNIIWVLILGIFQYGLANLCFSRGIQRVDALEGSLILTIEPIFNPIPVWILCGEKMGVRAILGSVIVIAFVALYAVSQKRNDAKQPDTAEINETVN